MARPCGCAGECGCTIVGVNGIAVSGGGSTRDPFLVGLNNPLGGNGCEAVLDCVGTSLGTGLAYNDTLNQITTRLSGDSGNNVVYGSDGGLYSAGGSGGTGDGGVTVDSLAATNIIGGYFGAGFASFPEATTWAYEAAMDIDEISFIHVPVRRLGDGYPAAQHSRDMAHYNGGYDFFTTLDFDMHMYKTVVVEPSGPADEDGNYDPLAGYFGTGHADTGVRGGHGGLLLSDVLRITARRKVLFLEILDVGLSVGDTLTPATTFATTLNIVQQWGLTKSVIAGARIPTEASADDKASTITGMHAFKSAGAATGIVILTTGEATAYPAATLANLYGDGTGPTWVFLHYEVVEANSAIATGYRTAGLNVMIIGAHRQYHYEMQRTLGVRGIDCADPVYAAGYKGGFRYRRAQAFWDWQLPNYGRHAYQTQYVLPNWERGYVASGQGGWLVIPQDLVNPVTTAAWQRSAYLILMGEQCPIPDPARDPNAPGDYGHPTNYDIEVGFSWDRIISDRTRFMSVFFGSPEDRPMSEWVHANQYTRGYEFRLSQNGNFTLQRYDGVPYTGSLDPTGPPWPYQFQQTWASSWGNLAIGTEYRILIQVRPGTITVGRLGPGSTVLNGRTFTNTDAGGRGDMWRGPYFYLGRHFWQESDGALCNFHTLQTRVY
jgi:hypothetical protein